MFVLRPSPIQGVGVFTTSPVARGDHLRLWQEEDWRFVTFAEAESDPELREFSAIYCVREAEGFHCPLDFHRMSIGWYMNHSDEPNARYRDATSFEYCAVRDIAAGEEIVCDYRLLSPHESAP
jgi:hypothetical protein